MIAQTFLIGHFGIYWHLMNDKKEIAVLYHADCPDGFGAAWAAWKKLGDSAAYIPVHHGNPPPDGLAGKEVYLLDFSYPEETFKALIARAKKVILIDHHKSAEPLVPLAAESLFDIEHSGAVLAWNYFHPGEDAPRLLKHVEDIDLWRFALSYTREISEALFLYDFDFAVWDKIVSDSGDDRAFQKYIDEGTVLLRKLEKVVAKIADRAEEIEFEGYRCLMVNATLNASHLGNILVKKMPPIGIVWFRIGDRIAVSLRSDGSVDVSELAQRYGGGGHKAAAGFSWIEKDFLKFKKG